jgi:leader peptidase (prepilin peptidase) / N-methyltransferase
MMLDRQIIGQVAPLFSAFVFILGTVVGSFLNVVIWRLPRGESLTHPGSHCPKCGHAIRPWENVPIISWLALRARCSQCHLPISARYPLIELANGVLYLILWWRLWHSAMPLSALWGCLFLGSALLAASIIDIEHFLIPDAITLPGMLVAALLAVAFPETHLAIGLTGLAGDDQLITAAVRDSLAGVGLQILLQPRVASLLDAGLGMLVGYLILRLLLEAGRRLWGRVRAHPRAPVSARLSATGLSIGEDDLDTTWEDLLVRPGDEFRARATRLTRPGETPASDGTTVDLRVTGGTLYLGATEQPLAKTETLNLELLTWEYPREVMGHGDLKLLALIGAFLGPDATVFVLLWGALLGCAWGGVRALLSLGLCRAPLPFGPFLAAGTFLWILFGQAFVRWYGGLGIPG